VQTSNPQRTRRATSPAKPAAASFSRAAAKLIEQIQAEARAALLEELSAKDGVTVLQPLEPETKRVTFDGDRLTVSDKLGNSVTLHRNRFEPESWQGHSYMAGYWHPARWIGDQTLVDASGVKWQRSFEPMVCDDFGNLVEVPA